MTNLYVQIARHRLDDIFQLIRTVITAEEANSVEDASPHWREAYALAKGLTGIQWAEVPATPKRPAFEPADDEGYEARFSD